MSDCILWYSTLYQFYFGCFNITILLAVQSCRTEEGYTCIFPFVYNGAMYNECAPDKSGKPWCPYKLKGDMTYDDVGVNKWDYCTSSCTWSQRHPNLSKF